MNGLGIRWMDRGALDEDTPPVLLAQNPAADRGLSDWIWRLPDRIDQNNPQRHQMIRVLSSAELEFQGCQWFAKAKGARMELFPDWPARCTVSQLQLRNCERTERSRDTGCKSRSLRSIRLYFSVDFDRELVYGYHVLKNRSSLRCRSLTDKLRWRRAICARLGR